MSLLLNLFVTSIVIVVAGCAVQNIQDDQFKEKLEARSKHKFAGTQKESGNVTETQNKKFSVLIPEKELESVIYLNTKLSKKMLMKSPLCGVSRTVMGFERKEAGEREQLQTFYEVFSYIPTEDLTDDYVKELKDFVVESFQQTNVDYIIMDYDGMSTMYKKS